MQPTLVTCLSEFDPSLPLAEARTAPASWYTSPEFHSAEAELLKSTWQFVAPLAFFREPGAFHSGHFLGEPYVILKDEAGELRAFFNVCRHHATCLVEGRGKVDSLTCPYHGWNYSLKGELLKAPALGAVKNFKKNEMGLVPIPLRVVGPFVLLNFSGNESPLPAGWDAMFRRFAEAGYDKLHFVLRREYELKCNWKVYVDNYLDGGYHVSQLHKGLASQLEIGGYEIENFDGWTLQSCGGKGDARIGDHALYAWAYPNFMINRYGKIMDTNWVVPLAHDRCLTVFDYYFADPDDKAFVDESLVPSERVQQEDIAISESVQRGLGSRAYGAGRYSVQHESGMHLFHQWLHRDLSRTLPRA